MAGPKHDGAAGTGFWEFSLKLYGRPKVAPACLRLQDRHRLDVNLILLCCYAGCAGYGAFTAAELRRADRAISAWRRQVVEPLRAARRALKSQPLRRADALRRRVLAAELEGEAVSQALLERWLKARGRRPTGIAAEDSAASLARYALFARPRLGRSGRADLDAILAAAASLAAR